MNEKFQSEQDHLVRIQMAALDSEKPSTFTQNILHQYKNGQVTSEQLDIQARKEFTVSILLHK